MIPVNSDGDKVAPPSGLDLDVCKVGSLALLRPHRLGVEALEGYLQETH